MSQGFTKDPETIAPTVNGADLVNKWAYQIITGNYVLGAGDQTVEVDATTGDITVTLPATPVLGQKYCLPRADETDNTVTINGNGNLIGLDGDDGNVATIVLGKKPASLDLQFNGTIWRII